MDFFDVDMASTKALKKKLASANTPKGAKRSRKAKSSAPNEVPFRFLDLPTELRNTIYKKVIDDSALVIERVIVTIHQPAVTAALACVNRQIRSEFLALTLDPTPSIQTDVGNWDFGHVIRLLNAITDYEGFACNVVIHLWFSGGYAEPAGLTRWLDRFGRDKRGEGIEFEYTCRNRADAEQNWAIADFRCSTVGGPQGRKQFEKIAEAMMERALPQLLK